MNVGERTNVTGSKAFARLILAGDYAEALSVARQQVENGAQVIDVNMDEAMLDSEAAMTTFLNLVAAEPDISRVPVMIDSSKWSVIEAGLKCVQGKGDRQLHHAEGGRGGIPAPGAAGAPLRRRGDRHGLRREGPGRHARAQHRICQRCYDAAHGARWASRPRTSSSTRTSSRSPRASRSTRATASTSSRHVAWIHATCRTRRLPAASRTSRSPSAATTPVREAMHTAFLYHAVKAGMTMGIVNAGQLGVYEDIPNGPARARRGRDLQPPAGCDRAPGRPSPRAFKGRKQGRRWRTSRGAARRSRSASRTRW